MRTIQATARFLSHFLVVYPGRDPAYSYAYDVDGAPWMEGDTNYAAPPGFLTAIRAREQAQAEPITIQSGSQSIALSPYVRAVLLYPDPEDGAILARIDVLYLDDGGNSVMEQPYVRPLTQGETAQQQAHENAVRKTIPINLDHGLQRLQAHRKLSLSHEGKGPRYKICDPKTGEVTGEMHLNDLLP